MLRIFLPLAVVAALLFAPMYAVEISDSVLGEDTLSPRSGYAFVENSIECWKAGNYSIGGECKPKGGLKGSLILAALLSSGIAAAIGVIGVLPFIGRLTSVITTLGGAIATLSVGAFGLMLMNAGSDSGEAIQWGTYLAGGGGLLTLVAGLNGMRGQ